MKKCIMCGDSKSLSCYYKHKQMKDGHLNKCKECCKTQSQLREIRLRKNPEWVEKEKERAKEKYRRLNYKGKQKKWDKDKVWKNTSTYKNLHRDLKIPKGISAHHWNYFKLKDVVLMDLKDHKSFHQLIELDIEKRIFKIKETGEYLDSRNKHLSFIITSGFGFVEYNKGINYKLPIYDTDRTNRDLIFIGDGVNVLNTSLVLNKDGSYCKVEPIDKGWVLSIEKEIVFFHFKGVIFKTVKSNIYTVVRSKAF